MLNVPFQKPAPTAARNQGCKRGPPTRLPLVAALAAVLALGTTPTIGAAATLTWDGGSAGTAVFVDGLSNDWAAQFLDPTNPLLFSRTNWSGHANLPKNGDLLQFGPLTLVQTLSSRNTFANLSVAGLRFLAGAGPYQLGGNAITIGSLGIINASSAGQTINMPITIGATPSTLDGGTAGLTINGALTLAGGPLTVQNKVVIDNATFEIGTTGSASLLLRSGSILKSQSGTLGFSVNAGTVTVSGADTRWNVTEQLKVGNHGSGTLNIESAGTVTSKSASVGFQSTGNGIATITGAGSSWTNSGEIVVGNGGGSRGTLDIARGGTLSSGGGTLGEIGSGIATVTGVGSSWVNLGGLVVGASGAGTLNIDSGGTVSSAGAHVGKSSGSDGIATITGAGSSWTISGALNVGSGSRSRGTLNITRSGTVSSTNSFIGGQGYAIATVSGAGSSWVNFAELVVGYSGAGTLNIESGGSVSSRSGLVGYENGSDGIATITGAGSSWTISGTLEVANQAFRTRNADPRGTLNIAGGGTVSSSHSYLGLVGTGIATVTGAGSTWITSFMLSVGSTSTGTLNVESGGMVSSATGVVGEDSRGTGVVTVTGTGSTWNNSGNLSVGAGGDGTLNIESSGTVSSKTVAIGALGVLNLKPGGVLRTESLTASGVFNWTGGTLNYTGIDGVSLGGTAPGLGSVVNLLAGQVLKIDNRLTVGSNVVLLSGGTLQAGSLRLGGGLVAATPGQTLDMTGIGNLSGYGTINAPIAGGAGNAIRAEGGTLSLGNLGAVGGFSYDGTLNVGSNQVALNAADRAMLGSLTSIGAGGRLAAINGSTLGPGRSLFFSGNASILGNFTNNGAVSGAGGTLTFFNDVNGAGSFSGNVAFHAGYSPGNSPATVNHNGGDVTFDSTSVLTMEILGPTPGTQYDQLVGVNKLTFNGRLSVVFGNGFAPAAGSNFRLFSFNTFAGSLGTDRINVTGFDRTQLDFSHLAQDGSFTVAAVPEPGSYAMFAAGLGLMGLMVRRRRSTRQT